MHYKRHLIRGIHVISDFFSFFRTTDFVRQSILSGILGYKVDSCFIALFFLFVLLLELGVHCYSALIRNAWYRAELSLLSYFVFCFVFLKKWEPLTDTQGYRAFTRNSITGKGRKAKAYRKNDNALKCCRPPCLLTQYLKQFTSSVKVGHTETKELRVAGVIRGGG